jgi:hypothetical protein
VSEKCGICWGELRVEEIAGHVMTRCMGDCLYARCALYMGPNNEFHRIQSALALLKRVEAGESVEIRKRAGEWPESPIIEVCHVATGDPQFEQEPPFVCGVVGKMSGAGIEDIEKHLLEELPEKGPGIYRYRVTWFLGQLDPEEGRWELPPGPELEELSFTPITEAAAAWNGGGK